MIYISLVVICKQIFTVWSVFSFISSLSYYSFAFSYKLYTPFSSSPSQGFRVFAGCLDADGEGAAALKRHGSSRLVVVQMDVTKEDQLAKAAQEVKKQLPEGGEDVHVCCFGL